MSNDSCSKCRPGKLCPGCDAIVTELAAALAPPPASPARTTGEERESVRRCAMVDWRRGWVIESDVVLRLLAERDELEARATAAEGERDELKAERDRYRGGYWNTYDELTGVRVERDRVVELLTDLEWAGYDVDGGKCCPDCGSIMNAKFLHSPGCKLADALATLSPATAAPGEPGKGPTACEHCGLAESMCLCHEEVTP